ATTIVRQPDGKCVVGGDTYGANGTDNHFELARLNPDGSLDSTFDGDGLVRTDFDISSGICRLLLQGDKIIAVGTRGSNPGDVALARYNSDGSLDSSFGTGGKVTADFGKDEIASCAVLSGDQILVGGWSNIPFTTSFFALWRFNFDGSLDTSFGSNGQV